MIAVATFVGLLFYVTSADSGALVMGNLCSEAAHVAGGRRGVACGSSGPSVTGLLTIADARAWAASSRCSTRR